MKGLIPHGALQGKQDRRMRREQLDGGVRVDYDGRTLIIF
jgi:hypothetical protein